MRNFVVAKLLLALIFYPEVHGQSEYVDEGSPRPQGEVGLLNTDEGQYNEVTAQHWINLQENPLDLNQITKEELLSLSLLSVSQINNFLRYVKIHGRLISIYELQAIPEFDVATIRKILPMVAVRPAINHYAGQKLTKRISRADNHYLVLRVNKTLEKKSGFDKGRQSRFAGSPYHWLIKYRSSHSKDFSLGFTMEKDPGERFAWQLRDHQPGPDFWSWHFTLRNRGNLKNLTLGDYKLQLGQGILFAAGFYPGKGSETITTIRRSNLGIVPHTSTAENGFLRGGAMTYQIRPVTLTVFYSNKMIDANLKFDSLSSSLLVSSIKESGLHRTASEISQRKSLHEQVGGVNITYLSKDKNLNLGQILSFTKYNLAAFKSDNLYKKFTNNDKLTMYAGYNFSYNWENFHFFGEAVLDNSGGYGLIVGALASLSSKVQSSLLFRKYDIGFSSPYGDAFSENSVNTNEYGVYWGLKILPVRRLTITAFMDIFQFPWLKFEVDRPSAGGEHLLALTYKPAKQLKITGLLRKENKAVNHAGESQTLNRIVTRQRDNYQLGLNNHVNETLTLKTNLQWSQFRKAGNKSTGFSVSQDLNLTLGSLKWSNRIMLFDTDNFDNRHYRYERDLLYALSIPSFSGSGYRYYTMFQAKLTPNISVWIKLARTIYFDRSEIGSGVELIDGPKKTDVRFQVRYAFK